MAEIKNIKSNKFKPVKTDKKFNWVNISDGSFEKLLPVCATKTDPQAIAKKHASGIKTNLDYYVYAFNRSELETRMKQFINTYNRDLTWYVNKEKTVSEIVANADKRIIKWTDTLKNSLKQRKTIEFDKNRIRQVLYRPFVKMWLYEDDRILSSVKTISAMFPRRENQRSIVVTDGSNNGSTDSLIPPPPHTHHLKQQPDHLHNPVNHHHPRSVLNRHQSTDQSNHLLAINLVPPSATSVFGVIANTTLPDLHLLGAGTRSIPRNN